MTNNKIPENKINSLSERLKIKYNLELKYGFECKQGNGSTLIETDINVINVNVYGIYFFIDDDEKLIYNPMSKSSKFISQSIVDINNRNPNNASYSKAYDAIKSCYRNNKKVYLYYIEISKNQMEQKEMVREIKNLCDNALKGTNFNKEKVTENLFTNLPPHYQWIGYFKHLTDKILEYQNNRDEFRKKVISVLSEYSKIGDYEISGIDPLSFIYELARLWIRKDKHSIYDKVAKEFEIKCNLSNIDKWIFINPICNTFFYYGNELQNNDIHWNIFTMAKNTDFIDEKTFQDILKIKNVSIAKLTQVLSIIEPEKYIAYDVRTTDYSLVEYLIKGEYQYSNYKKHIENIKSLFPKCSLYEINVFIKINSRLKNDLNRKIYQISSYMDNGVNGTKDHTEFFYNQSAVYVDGEESERNTRYPINEPKKSDIMIARYGNKVNGIGIIIDNQYETGFTLDKRIYIVWVNKTSYNNTLHKPQDIALKEMTEQDIIQCKNVYRETFKILGIDDMEYKAIKDIKNLLEFKKQIILQGAPGTGKTYTAKKVAEAMGCRYEIIQFHPSYTYEDFVRGIVSKTDEYGNIKYEVEDKILMNAIVKAEEDKNKSYILIIDEINRANLPSVLGELLYALEYRDEAVICPYKKEKEDDGKIIIPKNLYIIGTMNTADRSIGSIDYAIRRRFAFYTVKANEDFINDDYSKKVFKYIKYEIIKKHLSEEYQLDDIMIGHSYFIFNDEVYSDVDLVRQYMNFSLQYNIIPLLEEYYKDGILIDKTDEKVTDKIKFDEIIKDIEKDGETE